MPRQKQTLRQPCTWNGCSRSSKRRKNSTLNTSRAWGVARVQHAPLDHKRECGSAAGQTVVGGCCA
jgi:hypothetical protein